jgi:hypothetical protein
MLFCQKESARIKIIFLFLHEMQNCIVVFKFRPLTKFYRYNNILKHLLELRLSRARFSALKIENINANS